MTHTPPISQSMQRCEGLRDRPRDDVPKTPVYTTRGDRNKHDAQGRSSRPHIVKPQPHTTHTNQITGLGRSLPGPTLKNVTVNETIHTSVGGALYTLRGIHCRNVDMILVVTQRRQGLVALF